MTQVFVDVLVVSGSLDAYYKSSHILTDKVGADIPPEMLNSIGALYFKLGKLDHAMVRCVYARGFVCIMWIWCLSHVLLGEDVVWCSGAGTSTAYCALLLVLLLLLDLI